MENVFGVDPCTDEISGYLSYPMALRTGQAESLGRFQDHVQRAGEYEVTRASCDMYELMKAQIANHPRYPKLVAAYLECRKVGAPPEVTTLLEEIERESHPICVSGEIGDDPELDDFMEAYCEVLSRYKEELSKPFDEARVFLTKIERQLSNLCKGASPSATTTTAGNEHSDEQAGSSDDEQSCGEVESETQEASIHPADQELKEMLMKKYSGYLSNLRKEFLKRRKKGKLPKDARLALMNWWNTHYRWPYPTDEEKAKLGELTGLDQKQINNWFINQRKRHWKPSENMRLALMEGVSGVAGLAPLYFDTGTDDCQ